MVDRLISVIVPVYNAEPYLSECILSLQRQTYENLQIILVNDGSLDNSGRICDQIKVQDSRFEVFHQKNAGVSAARNAALEKASGDYIFFMDADDVLPQDSLQILAEKMEEDALVVGEVRTISRQGVSGDLLAELPPQCLTPAEMLELLFFEERLGYQGYLWNKLYARSVIQTHQIRFQEGICYNEDRLFLTEYLMHCSLVNLTNTVVYLYRQHEASALGRVTREFREVMLTELEAFERIKCLVKEEYPRLCDRVSFLAFEKALYWLGCVPRSNMSARKYVKGILRKNGFHCFMTPSFGLMQKVKIAAHCILEK